MAPESIVVERLNFTNPNNHGTKARPYWQLPCNQFNGYIKYFYSCSPNEFIFLFLGLTSYLLINFLFIFNFFVFIRRPAPHKRCPAQTLPTASFCHCFPFLLSMGYRGGPGMAEGRNYVGLFLSLPVAEPAKGFCAGRRVFAPTAYPWAAPDFVA